jgi:FMN phosphatase YigB (HAD superfamily)
MPLTDRKVLTFDVVGTLIDFETAILDYVQGFRLSILRWPPFPRAALR